MSARNTQRAQPQSSAPRSQVATVAFVGAFIVAGLLVLGQTAWQLVRGLQSEHWPTTEGVIKKAAVSHRRKQEEFYLCYWYTVAGVPYVGTQGSEVAPDPNVRESAFLTRYPVGSKVQVHYLPADPAVAVLETGIPSGTWSGFWAGTLFVVVGWAFLRIYLAPPAMQKKRIT